MSRGNTQEDILSSLASRLIRLEKQINEKEKNSFIAHTGGFTIGHVVKQLLNAYDPDTIESIEKGDEIACDSIYY